jgi:hypothetical protein
MNERIKELELEAAYGVIDPNGPFTPEEFNNFTAKFAELIVRECLTFVEPMPGSGDIDDLALEAAREGIKEHFGVEE